MSGVVCLASKPACHCWHTVDPRDRRADPSCQLETLDIGFRQGSNVP
jgi:hypothetical protein